VIWISTAVGPSLGGALIGVLGPVVTVVADAVSYMLSAIGIRAIANPEPAPPARITTSSRVADIREGWRTIAAHRNLRLLFANTVVVTALIMATAPLLTYVADPAVAWAVFPCTLSWVYWKSCRLARW
jgi:hypothetical protein